MARTQILGMLGCLSAVCCCTRISEADALVKSDPSPIFQVTARLLEPHEYRHEFGEFRGSSSYREALCTVTNVSKTSQTIETMSCSWNENWQVDDFQKPMRKPSNDVIPWGLPGWIAAPQREEPTIYCPRWGCSRNITERTRIAPGGHYEKVLPLITRQLAGTTVLFRLGFSVTRVEPKLFSVGEDRYIMPVVWTEPLTLSVPK